jgi:hypothetical protein
MKRLLLFVAAGLTVGYAVACIDFDASQQAYCENLSCQQRAQICADGPQITTMVPDKNATGVALNSTVVVTYNTSVTCSDAGIALVQYTGGEPPVPGAATCSGDNRAVFTPSVPLLSGRVYKVYVNECQVVDDAGVGGLVSSWTFTTQ